MIKYRQVLINENGRLTYHYWGYLHNDIHGNPVFTNPIGCVESDKRPSYQFTGLKDKNGKDLNWWEGDLLSFPNCKVIYKIFWNKDEGQWCARRTNFIAHTNKDNHQPLYRLVDCGFEIIGNIHEKENKNDTGKKPEKRN